MTYPEQAHALGARLAHHLLELLPHDLHARRLLDERHSAILTRHGRRRASRADPAHTLVAELALERLAAVSEAVDQRVELAALVLLLQSLARQLLEVRGHGLQFLLESLGAIVAARAQSCEFGSDFGVALREDLDLAALGFLRALGA